MKQSSEEVPTIVNLQFEYAWRYFQLHANQRVTMFNFFLVGSGILANGYALLLDQGVNGIAGGFAVIGVIASIVFFLLDNRNHQLVNLAETVLRNLEVDVIFPSSAGLLKEDKKESDKNGIHVRHWMLIGSVQAAVGIGFSAAAVYAFIWV